MRTGATVRKPVPGVLGELLADTRRHAPTAKPLRQPGSAPMVLPL